ncbi:MAG: PDZ domain-containing protein [Planctomycetes bacterium]|nr:PDZ domain-containing protein [Planctomycetota bacterium]
MPDAAPPAPQSPTDRAETAPPRFCWPMRIFLGFIVFDMVFQSLAALTPSDEWRENLDVDKYPRRLPTAEERRALAAKASAQNAHARLGADLASPDTILIKQLALPEQQGLVIEEVHKDGAAATVGLKEDDVLLELDGKAVPRDVQDFARLLETIEEDTAVDVLVLRRGKKEKLKGLRLPGPVPLAIDPVAERIGESADSVWSYFKPWPPARVRRRMRGWGDGCRFAVCWLTTRLNFLNNLVRFEQGWEMFSPDIAKEEFFVRVRLQFADRSKEVFPLVSYPEDLTRYGGPRFFDKKMRQVQVKLARDGEARLGYCALIARQRPHNDRGSPLEHIYLYKVKVHYPAPGEDAEAFLREQNGAWDRRDQKPYYEYDVKARNGYQLDDR